MLRIVLSCSTCALILLPALAAAEAATDAIVPESIVISASPLAGSSLDAAKLPVTIDSLTPEEIARFGSPDVLHALATQAPGVSFSDAQNNPFQPNLFYRGFEASPLAGDAQGLAVYAGGVRLNHPFGDTVDWDLIPETAISSLNIESTNPVFGLNALGGSVAMQFKNGFGFQGNQAVVSGGSFGRLEGGFQSGVQEGDTAFYAAAEGRSESGWREHSPSGLYRLFADFDRQGAGWRMQLDVLGARSNLTGNGVSPVELLQASRAAVFTYPDTTRNGFALVNLETSVALSDAVSINGNLYLSRFDQRTLNGNASNFGPCDTQPSLLCLDNGEIATDLQGQAIEAFPIQLTYGQLDQTATGTTGFGGALEANTSASLFGRNNQLVLGGAWDAGRTRFSADTAVGGLSSDRGFTGPGTIVDLPDGVIAPVAIKNSNDYLGLYAADRLDLTTALSVTISGRYNLAEIGLLDLRGTALTGSHGYSHFNPAAGLTYAINPFVSLYGGYSEANRAPAPSEFSCAGANTSCTLTNFFVADPGLKQVVAQNVEAGLRGSDAIPAFASVHWHLAFYRSGVIDDIQFVASPIIGRGFFENVGATRRQGAEFAADASAGLWSLSVNYSYTDATFQSPLVLNSPDNPFADANGEITIRPGDHLPGIPANLVKVLVAAHVTNRIDLTLAMRAASGVYLRGDEANLNPKIPGYAVFDIGAKYRFSDALSLFAGVSNLFDAKYANFGAFSPIASVPLIEAPGASNPRSLSPAPPRWFSVGLSAQL
jgi:iron complex outermembrane recepter protein